MGVRERYALTGKAIQMRGVRMWVAQMRERVATLGVGGDEKDVWSVNHLFLPSVPTETLPTLITVSGVRETSVDD